MEAGLYLPGESALHNLDSRLKVGGLVAVSLLITTANYRGLVSLTLGLLILLIISQISIREFRSLILAIVFIGIFYAVVLGWNWTDSWHFWQGHWSLDGLIEAGVIVWRISLIFILTRLFSAVTSPSEQGLGIAYFFTPLTRITPKAADFSLLITLTLRFIPLLIEEAGLLYKARVAKGNLPLSRIKKVIELAAFLLPLILLTLRRAEELAENLLARGYVSGGYRVLGIMEWERKDSLGTLILFIWCFLTLLK